MSSIKDKRVSCFRTICEIHREIYDIITENKDVSKDLKNKIIFLLEDAYKIGKKMECKLRQYKNNYDDDWYQKTSTKIIKEKLQKRKINKSTSEIFSKARKK